MEIALAILIYTAFVFWCGMRQERLLRKVGGRHHG